VPTFDIDRAFETTLAQDRDDVRPVRVAEAGRAMPNELLPTPKSLRLEDIPGDRRVFAVNVIDAVHPLAELGERIDEGNHLVTRLPFQTKSVARHRVKHHFPGSGGMRDIPLRIVPSSAHIAVLEGDFDPFAICYFC